MGFRYLSTIPVVRVDKRDNSSVLVGVAEVLEFAGTAKKKREEALVTLIEGGIVQNAVVAYYVEPLHSLKQAEHMSYHERVRLLAKEVFE